MSALLDACPVDLQQSAAYLKGASLAFDYAATHTLEENQREYAQLMRVFLRLKQCRIQQHEGTNA